MSTAALRRASSPTVKGGSDDKISADARLFEIINANSYGRKKITLSSGRESDFYFDMKPSMLNPEGAVLISQRILEEIVAAKADFVGGLEIGAVPIIGAVSQLSFMQRTPVYGLFVRKTKKEHGAKKLIEAVPPNVSLTGKRVVVVDDVTTSGESAMKAISALRDEGANVVLAISIVDRCEGAAELFAREGIPFKSLYSANAFHALHGK